MKGRGSGHLGLLLLTAALTGCATIGLMSGRLFVPGQLVAPVVFRFESDRSGKGGTLSVRLPSGEAFSGRYGQITPTTPDNSLAPFFTGWAPGWSDWGPFGEPWLVGADVTTFVRNYSGKVVATLVGDKGGAMRCRFRLSDPEAGMDSRGVGECQVSSGGRIDVQF